MALPTKDKVYLFLLCLALAGCAAVYFIGQLDLKKQKEQATAQQAAGEQQVAAEVEKCGAKVEKQLESTVKSFVTTVAFATGSLYSPDNSSQLTAMFDKLVLSQEIELLVAADATGKVTASTNRNLIGKTLERAFGMPMPGDEPTTSKTESGWKALSPFNGTNEQTGAVGVVFTTAEAQH